MYPTYVSLNGKRYDINTDFRVAIRCSKIATDKSITNTERALAIIYLLFGEEALNDDENGSELLDKALLYLSCGKEVESNDEEPDMDYEEDMDYIEASFMSDYHIDLSNIKMHWWKFNKLINGLSNSEMGNCCVLNRIRNLRDYDVSTIKDKKERDRIIKAQERIALKSKKKQLTKEQEESAAKFFELLGGEENGL